MPRLPAAGAGRAETDSRSGVKADFVIISTFPGSPALGGGELHFPAGTNHQIPGTAYVVCNSPARPERNVFLV